MRVEAEQLFWVHTRGLSITLPPESTRKIALGAFEGGEMPREESSRLTVILNDPILRKRHPQEKDGEAYMEDVCCQRRCELYDRARFVTDRIVEESRAIGESKIAVILFGSIAKSLVRKNGHEDPSNIDLAVIGHFTRCERDEIFDRIRPVRQMVAAEIGNNVGVFIQNVEAVARNNFDSVLTYIGSSARPLYDEFGIWRKLEAEALELAPSLARYSQHRRNGTIIRKLISDRLRRT